MTYTRKNLLEVNDSAPQFGFGEIGEARFPNRDLGLSNNGISLHRVKPGRRQAFGHNHTDAEEVYVVIGGSGRMAVGEDVIEISRFDAIRVSPETIRAFEAGDEGLEVLAFGQLAGVDGSEMFTGWWADTEPS